MLLRRSQVKHRGGVGCLFVFGESPRQRARIVVAQFRVGGGWGWSAAEKVPGNRGGWVWSVAEKVPGNRGGWVWSVAEKVPGKGGWGGGEGVLLRRSQVRGGGGVLLQRSQVRGDGGVGRECC